MNNKKLSILIPTYNRSGYLVKCLESIDFRDDIEIIISDNNSNYLVDELIPKRITEITRLYKRSENVGPRLNIAEIGLHAKGEYILYISDDDIFTDLAIGRILKEIEKGSFDIAFFALYINLIVSNKKRYYGFLRVCGIKIAAIIRAQVLTGCLMRREYFLKVYERKKEKINSSWYMLIIFVLEARIIKLYSKAFAVHLWENETYWGINPESSVGLLNQDKMQNYKEGFFNKKVSKIQYLILRFLDTHIGVIISAILFKFTSFKR